MAKPYEHLSSEVLLSETQVNERLISEGRAYQAVLNEDSVDKVLVDGVLIDEVLIDHITLTQIGDQQELSARVDGERLWFRFPTWLPLTARAEIFLPAALQEAMVRGVPLRVLAPQPISSRLLNNLQTLQSVLVRWNDEDFKKVAIIAEHSAVLPAGDMVISAYSGGVDSAYTYVSCAREISHLVLIQGFDGVADETSWQQNVNARQAFADAEGKQLIAVTSNIRSFMERRHLSWSICHGSLLGAMAVTLSAATFYIPSSFTYNDLFAWGSHPLLDPLWSTETTTVIHHGADTARTAKTAKIAEQQNVLDHLQVCWRGVAGNCGNCPKCVRTSLALHLLGKTSRSLPAYRGGDQLRWLKPGNQASVAFTEDLIQFCLRHHAHGEAKRLKRFRQHFLLKYHSAELLKLLLGKPARALSHRLWPKSWHQDRAKLQASRNWLL